MTLSNAWMGRQLWLRHGPLFVVFIVLCTSVTVGALATRQPILILLAALVAPVVLAVFAQPDLATLGVLFLIYTNAAVVAVHFHHVPQAIGAVVPLMLGLPLANYLAIQRRKIIINPVLLLLIFFLLIQILGTLFARDINHAFGNLVTFMLEGIVLYFLIINVVRTPEVLAWGIGALLLAGLFLGGISVYQQATGTFNQNYGGFAQVDENPGFKTGEETLSGAVTQLRLAGPIGEKNYYAQIMSMLVPLGLFQFLGSRSKLWRLLALAATGFAMAGALLTFSRGAIVSFGLLLIIMLILRYIKLNQVVILVAAVLLCLPLVPQLGKRLSSLDKLTGLVQQDSGGAASTDIATQGRLGEMMAGAMVFIDNPIIGVGPGMFKFYYSDYAALTSLRTHSGNREAHDLYLDIGAQNGILGLACFLGMVFITFRDLARSRKRWLKTNPELANIATGFMLALVSYLTTGIFLSLSYERYYWMMLALAWAASHIKDSDDLPEADKNKQRVFVYAN